MKRTLHLCFIAAWVLIAGAAQAATPPLTNPGTLRDKIPNEAIAYVRIPGLFADLPLPAFTKAQEEGSIVQAAVDIRNAFQRRVSEVPANQREPISTLLVGHLRSPIEVAALLVPVNQRPQPVGMLTMELDVTSVAEANALVRSLAEGEENLAVMSEMSAGGPGVVSYGGAAAAVHFAPDTRVLTLIFGAALTQDLIAKLTSLPPNPGHPMQLNESQIDPSGQGLFAWVDVQKTLPFGQVFMPPETLLLLEKWGLMDARSLSLGIGASKTKGKIRLQLDVPRSGLLELLPSSKHSVKLRSHGEPRFAVLGGGLEGDTTARIKTFLGELADPSAADEFDASLEEIAAQLGFAVDDVFAALGPRIIGFSDDAGEYGAISIRDAAAWAALKDRVAAREDVTLRSRDFSGIRIFHLRQTQPAGEPVMGAPYDQMLTKAGTVHAFWVEEDGYVVFAATPQALRDRYRKAPRFSMGPWLRANAGESVDAALLHFSARFEDIPRFMYSQYLIGLNLLNDAVDANVDVFDFPSAGELGLPRKGALTGSLHMSDRQIALALSYDGTPFDFMAVPSAGGAIVVAGIAAAVAVPAYQDYMLRARIQESVALTRPARTAVGIACSQGTLTPGMGNAELSLEPAVTYSGPHVQQVDVRVLTDGRAVVQATVRGMGSSTIPDGSTVVYEGTCTQSGVTWEIGGTVPPKYLPKR